jgi:hypothetical protein
MSVLPLSPLQNSTTITSEFLVHFTTWPEKSSSLHVGPESSRFFFELGELEMAFSIICLMLLSFERGVPAMLCCVLESLATWENTSANKRGKKEEKREKRLGKLRRGFYRQRQTTNKQAKEFHHRFTQSLLTYAFFLVFSLFF